MKTWAIILLSTSNIALLISQSVSFEAIREIQHGQANLRAERQRIDTVRARLDDRVGALTRTLRDFREAQEGNAMARAEAQTESSESSAEASGANDPKAMKDEHRLWVVSYLSAEEKQRLEDLRAAMPTLGHDVLLEGSVDDLLQDSSWNPGRKQLDPMKREEARGWLEKFRFYARSAAFKRIKEEIEPEVTRLREEGAYLEYPAHEAPPAVPGVLVSHAEESDKPGMLRIYYFDPNDYPEMDRQVKVERERSFEAYVELYYAING